MSLLIPGPKSLRNDFDVFLEPLIEELLELWKGVSTLIHVLVGSLTFVWLCYGVHMIFQCRALCLIEQQKGIVHAFIAIRICCLKQYGIRYVTLDIVYTFQRHMHGGEAWLLMVSRKTKKHRRDSLWLRW
jgi:hypothetical protein